MENKYVFISYSSANKGIADATCHILEECGIPCWIAPRNIILAKPGLVTLYKLSAIVVSWY